MTEVPDARVAAWTCAWTAMQAAGEIRSQVTKERGDEPLPDIYWASVAEAAVFADLARADMSTGVTAVALINGVETVKKVALDTIAQMFGVSRDTDNAQAAT